MPHFRNLNLQQQSRHSGRLENRTPIAYDAEGWQFPLGTSIEGHATLQDACLSPGARVPPSESDKNDPFDQESSSDPSSFSLRGTDDCFPTRLRSPSPSSYTSSSSSSASPVRHAPYQRKNSHARRAEEGHVPRPRNAFIIFRSWYNVNKPTAPPADGGKTNQNEVSKQAGKAWKNMSVKERQPFAEQAEQELVRHRFLYPGYRYAPSGRKATAAKYKARPQQKQMRVPQKSESDDEHDGSMYNSDHGAGLTSLAVRSLRPRSARTISYRSPSPSPFPSPPFVAHTPSPPHSSTSSPRGEEDDSSSEDDDFVPTEDIPALNLPPRVCDPIKKEESHIPQFDLNLQPPNMDSDINEHWGFKSYLSPSVALSFLPPLPKCEEGEAEGGWKYKPESTSPSSTFDHEDSSSTPAWNHVVPPPDPMYESYLINSPSFPVKEEDISFPFQVIAFGDCIYDDFDFKTYYQNC